MTRWRDAELIDSELVRNGGCIQSLDELHSETTINTSREFHTQNHIAEHPIDNLPPGRGEWVCDGKKKAWKTHLGIRLFEKRVEISLLLAPVVVGLRLRERLRFRAGPLDLETAHEAQHGVRARIPFDVPEASREHRGDLPRMHEVASIGEPAQDAGVRPERLSMPPRLGLPVLPALDGVERAQRERGLAVARLERRGRAEGVCARRDAVVTHVVEDAKTVLGTAEKRKCYEECLEMCRVGSIRGRRGGRHAVIVRTVAVMVVVVAVEAVLASGFQELRAVLEELIVKREKLILALAKVDESAPDEGRVVG